MPQLRLRLPLPHLPRNIVWLKLNAGQLLQEKYSLVTELERKKSLFNKILTNLDEPRWNSVTTYELNFRELQTTSLNRSSQQIQHATLSKLEPTLSE